MTRNRRKTADGETTYWLSYSDMMAALLLVFVLIITFTMLQSKSAYEAKESELKEVQQQLDDVMGVRSNLIAALRDEFSTTDLNIDVDPQTGAITFDSSILFDFSDYTIKKSGKDFLREFLPKYFDVLLSENFKEHVAEIIIEGHTDSSGPYLYNLELSQKRALSVANFCLAENNGFISNERGLELSEYSCALKAPFQ